MSGPALDIDALAQEIRRIGCRYYRGNREFAEQLAPYIASLAKPSAGAVPITTDFREKRGMATCTDCPSVDYTIYNEKTCTLACTECGQIKQLASQPDARDAWISVADRLPTDKDYGEEEDVLVRYRYTDEPARPWMIGDSFIVDGHKYNGGWLFGSCHYAEVSHWMPKSALLAAIADTQL